jgi:hypothetical protein
MALGDLAGIVDQPLSVAASVFVFNIVFLVKLAPLLLAPCCKTPSHNNYFMIKQTYFIVAYVQVLNEHI